MRRFYLGLILSAAIVSGATVSVTLAAAPVFNGNVVSATMPTVNVLYYGAKGDGVTDNSAAISNALTALADANGGTLYFPPGTYRINSAIQPTCNGSGQMSPIRFTGGGPSWQNNSPGAFASAALDLRYTGGDGLHNAKIDLRCTGYFEMDHLTITDKAADDFLFWQTTNTTVVIHDNAFVGDGTKQFAAAAQDAGQLGGTSATVGQGQNAPYQGYVSQIYHNQYQNIRRALIFNVFANASVVRDEWIMGTSGCSQAVIANCAPYYFNGVSSYRTSNLISDVTIESSYYPYGVSCPTNAYCSGNVFENIGLYDAMVGNLGGVFLDATSTGNSINLAYQSSYSSNSSISTSIAGSISAGLQTVTPASMSAITTSTPLLVDANGVGEWVTPSATTGTTFTATFALAHGANSVVLGYAPVVAGSGYSGTIIRSVSKSQIVGDLKISGSGTIGSNTAFIPTAGTDLSASRSTTCGALHLGGSTTHGQFDFGCTTAGKFTLGADTIFSGAIFTNSTAFSTGFAGDLNISRNTTAGIMTLGGTSSHGTIDYGSSNSGKITLSPDVVFGGAVFTGGTGFSTGFAGDLNISRNASVGLLTIGGTSNHGTLSYSTSSWAMQGGPISFDSALNQSATCKYACKVTLSSGTVTWTFGAAYSSAPVCVATPEGAPSGTAVIYQTITTAHDVITSTDGTDARVVDIVCHGYPN